MSGREDLCKRCEGDLILVGPTSLVCDTCGLMVKIKPRSPRVGWWRDAKCRLLPNGTEIMFIEPVNDLDKIRAAKEVCRGCIVLDDCLSEALINDEEFGIWGGLTRREREIKRYNPRAIELMCKHCGMNYIKRGGGNTRNKFCSLICRKAYQG